MLAAVALAATLPLPALARLQTRAAERATTTTVSTTVVRGDAGSHTRALDVESDSVRLEPAAVRWSSSVPSCADRDLGRRFRGTHLHTRSDDGGSRVVEFVVSGEGRCAAATLVGPIDFTTDERDVASLAPGAVADFRERSAAGEWTLRVTAGAGGSLTRAVTRDGRPAAYDAAARAWLAEFLPEVLREAAINVPERVARLRAAGGSGAVLAEIARIRSGSAKRAHFEALLGGGRLSPDDAERVARQAGRELASSGDLSAVLQKLPPGALTTPGARAAVGEALTRIASSGDKRSTLETLAPTADRDLLLELAEAARALPSSGDLRDVLVHALRFAHAAPGVTDAVIAAAGRVASSGDRSDVLLAVADARLLTTPASREAYMRAAEALPASGDRRRALAAVLHEM